MAKTALKKLAKKLAHELAMAIGNGGRVPYKHKTRAPIRPPKIHGDKTKYTRKRKHKNKEIQ